MTRPRTGRRHLLAMLTTLPAATRAGRLLAATPPAVAAPLQRSHRSPKPPGCSSLAPRTARSTTGRTPCCRRSSNRCRPIPRSAASRSAAPMVSPAPTSSRHAARRMARPCCWCRAGGRRLDGRRPPRTVRRGPLGAGNRRRQPGHRGRPADGAGAGWPRPGRRRRPGQFRSGGAAGRPTAPTEHGAGVRPGQTGRGAKRLRAGRRGRGAVARGPCARAVLGALGRRCAAAVHPRCARRRRPHRARPRLPAGCRISANWS